MKKDSTFWLMVLVTSAPFLNFLFDYFLLKEGIKLNYIIGMGISVIGWIVYIYIYKVFIK